MFNTKEGQKGQAQAFVLVLLLDLDFGILRGGRGECSENWTTVFEC